jgi:luciferase family oxidoreductase group 1
MTPFSVLDLAMVNQGASIADALNRSRELAHHVETLGFQRFWLAEHHNMPGIASAATSVVIAHVGSATTKIRLGAGGVMLPNHSPLVIAEQFGTLEALFPGRIDLGLGRAPGTDQPTARALRRGGIDPVDRFPEDVVELRSYFHAAVAGQLVQAVPGAGQDVPIWLLGSSLYSAQLAAALGLPFAFAAHFAPDYLDQAFAIYRARFEPSASLGKPYAMVAVGAYLADTDSEANRLLSSLQQSFLALRRGTPQKLPPPVDAIDSLGAPQELAGVHHAFREAIVGSPSTAEGKLRALLHRTAADEVMFSSAIFDRDARHRSFELLAEIRDRLV